MILAYSKFKDQVVRFQLEVKGAGGITVKNLNTHKLDFLVTHAIRQSVFLSSE